MVVDIKLPDNSIEKWQNIITQKGEECIICKRPIEKGDWVYVNEDQESVCSNCFDAKEALFNENTPYGDDCEQYDIARDNQLIDQNHD